MLSLFQWECSRNKEEKTTPAGKYNALKTLLSAGVVGLQAVTVKIDHFPTAPPLSERSIPLRKPINGSRRTGSAEESGKRCRRRRYFRSHCWDSQNHSY